MNIGKRLRDALDALNMNIKESAEKAGIPYRSMQNYLRGEREPGADALASISEQLGISIDWLLTGVGEMRKNTSMAQGTPLSPQEAALLELFKGLSEKDQREICQDAQEKKRLAELERQVQELAAQLERLNSAG